MSPTIMLTEVDTLIREGHDRRAILDLTKAYDRVDRQLLMDNCIERREPSITAMLTAFLQDVQGTTAEIRLGLTQGTALSPILFLVYIDDILRLFRMETCYKVQINELGGTEVSMTAEDVIIHAKEWVRLISWLDACSRWAF